MNTVLDRPEALRPLAIEDCLPHRGQALFVRAAEVQGDTVVGEADWSLEHAVLQGHFPGRPVVPGVFLIEAAAQLGGVWIARTHPQRSALGVLASVRRALIHRLVAPGERLRYRLQVSPAGEGFFGVRGQAHASRPDGTGDKVLTVDLLIGLSEIQG